MRIRHILPGQGKIPTNLDLEPVSGLIASVLGFASQQAKQGHRVQVFGWRPDRLYNSYSLNGVQIRTTRGINLLRLGGFDFRHLGPMVVMGLLDARVEISHLHSNPFYGIVPWSDHIVLHLHGDPNRVNMTEPYKRALRKASAVVCCSDFVRQAFLRRMPDMVERTFVVYSGVNWTAFAKAHSENIRADLGLADSQIALLFAGALHREKGVSQLLEAFRILSRQCNDVHLLLAGSDRIWSHIDSGNRPSYENKLRAEATGLPITFLGSVPYEQMPKIHQAADILILPSVVQDANPPVVLEAMAAGRPVVASKVGGVPELVMDGETGLLVEAGNVHELVEALNRLIHDADLRSRLGTHGQTVARQFDWEIVNSQLMDIYRDVVL